MVIAVLELVETLVPVPFLVTDVLVLLELLDELPETALLEAKGPVCCDVLTPTRTRPGSTLTPTSDVESVNASRSPPSRAFTATRASGTGTGPYTFDCRVDSLNGFAFVRGGAAQVSAYFDDEVDAELARRVVEGLRYRPE